MQDQEHQFHLSVSFVTDKLAFIEFIVMFAEAYKQRKVNVTKPSLNIYTSILTNVELMLQNYVCNAILSSFKWFLGFTDIFMFMIK